MEICQNWSTNIYSQILSNFEIVIAYKFKIVIQYIKNMNPIKNKKDLETTIEEIRNFAYSYLEKYSPSKQQLRIFLFKKLVKKNQKIIKKNIKIIKSFLKIF